MYEHNVKDTSWDYCEHNIKWSSNKQKANLLLQSMKDNAKQKKWCRQKQCTIQMNKKVTNLNLQLSWLGTKPYNYWLVQKNDTLMTSSR
jgi:hypothetical protein